MSQTVTLLTRVAREELEQFRAIAARNERSISQQLRLVIREYLEREREEQ